MLKKVFLFFSKSRIKKYFLIILGTISWSLVMVRSGLCWDKGCAGGIGFWGANGHDGIWHLALIKSLAGGSFRMPTFAGWDIQNYHIGFDVLMSWIVRLTGVSVSVLYFQIVPPILALLAGFLVYKFVKDWRHSEVSAWWATFFVYFGGSFGWLVSIIRGQGWGGESMFWSMQSVSTLINPPFALSLITILSGLIFLRNYLNKKTWINFLFTVVFFGASIFIKVYAGLLVLTALLGVFVWQIIKKKDISFLGVFFVSLTISVFLFIPFNKTSLGLISYKPFWFLESMMALSDRFNWQKMYSAMTTYKMGGFLLKEILSYGLAFAIFILGNFGTRIIALKSFFQKPKKLLSAGPIEIFIFVIVLAGIVVPTFFVQKGTPWNTIQFIYYSLFFTGIVSGVVLSGFMENSHIRTSIIQIIKVTIIFFTVPTTIASLGNYLGSSPPALLPKGEIEALNFLSNQSVGTVLTYPYDENLAKITVPPRPLYLYTSTAYVSAFSGQPVFLEDQINLDIMQYPWHERRREIEDFLDTLNIEEAGRFLRENNIKYVYWIRGQHARIGDSQLGLTKVFENEIATIFKVN